MAGSRPEAAEMREPGQRGIESGLSGVGDFVIATRRSTLAPGHPLALPVGADEAECVETTKRRIDGPRLEPGLVGDIEAVARALSNRLQHQGRGQRDVRHVFLY